ncbi:histidine phosphatase family protein [Acinetobacter larvae]|uniref:Histidine phosphatase family protein n=1 Tax=Acinetobacter larvae TaxID=1789224 RepID=A0A1B2LZQ0_9GAMM|nr:histidine phosphatase family protein [Acinetobacter larvae]AOA58420.1 histidine phosphatase family protein [Acinetobacter larvae]
MSTVYLIRHGQASFGADNYDCLSDKGRLQAQLLGRHLADLLKHPPHVIAGSMQRHQDTAKLALTESFPDAVIHTDAQWNEFDHHQVFAKYDQRFESPALLKQAIVEADNPSAYFDELFSAAAGQWSNPTYAHLYQESWQQFQQRIAQALEQLIVYLTTQPTANVLLFSSGGVISTAVGQLLDLTMLKTFQLNWSIANCSISSIRIQDLKAQLLSLNEHQFIKVHAPHLLTWL